ncbi:hypothetical protein HDF08_002142 [Edaphobacter lichenicola]|uniref:Uncharacterized protein n=1 Tax=Tunturiibacter lichenicola TaxID=2051959 RepID=A0A852VIS0_9BACT|nr:hypothetical protein [Edaphobacter lichenicola]
MFIQGLFVVAGVVWAFAAIEPNNTTVIAAKTDKTLNR